MPQSPELAGGEGFTFEGDAAAFYLTSLLAEAYAPGIDDRIVTSVSVQQRDLGEPLDDVIVDFEDVSKGPARLSLQVKRSLTISKAKTNSDFREIIHDSWNTLQKANFRVNVDRYGAAVGTINPTKDRVLKTLCDWARESLTAEHFEARFADAGSASVTIKSVKDDIASLLKEAKGDSCTIEEVHKFLAHFVLVKFDFLREGSTDPSDAINRLRDCIALDEVSKAPLLWSRMVHLSRSSTGKSGQFDRKRLVHFISPIVRLRGATSLRFDLAKISEISTSYTNLIPDDIGGTKLDRSSRLRDLDAKLTNSCFVQVRGLPGSGKSVVIKQSVLRALQRGPTLFLKAEQIEGTSWNSYAQLQGLSGASLEYFLVEIGAVGTPILFIDAIDRVHRQHQPIVLDLIRTITESPLLENWSIVVSLRDTGIEVLRNWLGDFLDILKVQTIVVDQMSDEEAESLAEAKPHLSPLLFGSTQVREIVRRPFFAKVLNQAYVADSAATTFAPRSEVDLIENWWRRGGYNEAGQSATERQITLLTLARIRASQLSKPIGLSQLPSAKHIDDLISDGILQNAREGVSIQFAHDIFFEWAFFHILAEEGEKWIEVIRSCGEPPAVARVVELTSQWEYVHGENWSTYLVKAERSDLRSQWLRAWLVAPLGNAYFESDETQFRKVVFADDFRLIRKVLVWFQAEKTTPNSNILSSELPQEKRQRYADLLAWPSDFPAWRRLINFLLQHIVEIPQRLYPEIVSIFEVWQNALASIRTPTSELLLQQCATWLAALDEYRIAETPNDNTDFWATVPALKDFRKSLSQLMLNASRAYPSFTDEYLERVINSKRIRDDAFHNVIPSSSILAQSLPTILVRLTLAFLKKELPEEQLVREREERRVRAERRKAILAKPEAERSHGEKMASTSLLFHRGFDDFTYRAWENLSIHDDYRNFQPPSPLREPFHSLFHSSPDEALLLLRELCNHAMTSWRQLHRHSKESPGTPLPLELSFPWGTQLFWGSDREYLWYRSTWAPKAIGSGFMALEKWCFEELEQGRDVDELIQRIVDGNECIATLGIAAILALQSEKVSAVILPLVTSQRLLAADFNRMVKEHSSTANLIGFNGQIDKPHIDAIRASNSRPVRKLQLSWLVQRFVFAEESIRERTRSAILNFKDNLPYQYKEHREIPEAQKHLKSQALKYEELIDLKTYQAYRTSEDSNEIAICHVSPSASQPQNVAKAEEATKRLRLYSLWIWASDSFDKKKIGDTFTIVEALTLAKDSDSKDLFVTSSDVDQEEQLGMRRGAVSATAALVLHYRDGRTQADLKWAREILSRASQLKEKPNPLWVHGAHIPWHQSIYVARGLAADIREGTSQKSAIRELLELIAHPLETVSLAAIEEACNLWPIDSKLTWAGLMVAFKLCHEPPPPSESLDKHDETHKTRCEVQKTIDSALAFYENGSSWPALSLPPPAWIKVESRKDSHLSLAYDEYDKADADDESESWGEPKGFWESKHAAEILKRLPTEGILNSTAKSAYLDFLEGALNYTIEKNSPPWVKLGRRDRPATRIMEWTRTLGSELGQAAGLLDFNDFKERFLQPILELESDSCWALLSPFTSTYICFYIYDAHKIPADTIALLDLCLDKLLESSTFKRGSYRSGELSGFDQPKLVRSLMFVNIEHAALAERYVNGDWSEIEFIIPLVDRFIRAGGWAACVMEHYLTLCERAKNNYPSEAFAEQILVAMGEGLTGLKGWHGTFIPARIAELVQHFAYRDAPLTLSLAQKFLRILDMLVDMGDRRSAALQLGESFRGVRLQ